MMILWISGLILIIILYLFFRNEKLANGDTKLVSSFIGLSPLSGSLRDAKNYFDSVIGEIPYDVTIPLKPFTSLKDTSELEDIQEFTPTIPNEWNFEDIKGEKKRERITRRVLETIYDYPFPTVRPEWLLNPKTGRRLEIDCYGEDPTGDGIGLCIEVSGDQHYKQGHFHKDRQAFLDQVYRDQVKKEIILERGDDFLVVPYTINTYDIPYYVIDKLRELGRL